MSAHGHPDSNCIPLMHQISAMANIPFAFCKRMVLVLDVDDVPRLFVETYLNAEKTGAPLVPTKLEVSDQPICVNTTTMQNETLHTYAPLGQDVTINKTKLDKAWDDMMRDFNAK